VNVILADVPLSTVLATALGLDILMIEIHVALALPAESYHVTTIVFVHATNVIHVLRDVVAHRFIPLTTTEERLVSDAVHAMVIVDHVSC